MNCPDCGEKLKSICEGEWICENPDCPSNEGYQTYTEYYGLTQAEINQQKRCENTMQGEQE